MYRRTFRRRYRRYRRRFRRFTRFRNRRFSRAHKTRRHLASGGQYFTRLVRSETWDTSQSYKYITPEFSSFKNFTIFCRLFNFVRVWKCVVKVRPMATTLPFYPEKTTSQGVVGDVTFSGQHGIVPWFDDRPPFKDIVPYINFLSLPNWREKSNRRGVSCSFRPKIPVAIPDTFVTTLNAKSTLLMNKFPLLDTTDLDHQRFFGCLYANSGIGSTSPIWHPPDMKYEIHMFLYLTFYSFRSFDIPRQLSDCLKINTYFADKEKDTMENALPPDNIKLPVSNTTKKFLYKPTTMEIQ